MACEVVAKILRTWEHYQRLTSKASPQVANISEWVQSVWLGLVGGGAVD